MNKRVYGIVGLNSKFANWNADFDGFPKRVDGKIFSSDKALKYVIRNYLADKNEPVFYKKEYNENGQPLTYEGKYKKYFNKEENGKKDKKKKNSSADKMEGMKNLLTFKDIKMFGTVAAISNLNFGIRGVVQFTHGINLYENTHVIREVITSQFASKEGQANTTIGDMILVNNADYFYSFALNTKNMKDVLELFGEESDKYAFNEEDYELFKESCLYAVDNYDSASKAGCNNSFALFVETEENAYMPNLADFLIMQDKTLILEDLIDYLKNNKDNIKKIELYYRDKYIQLKEKELEDLKNIGVKVFVQNNF